MKLLLVAGARPNFMKLAPLVKAIASENADHGTSASINYCLVHTGQHYDKRMSDVFFKELGIPSPDYNLDVGSGSHAVQTANIMTRFEPVCYEAKPDWVVVFGDVNSTVACTLVSAKMGVKVAHVEAGLRSFDRSMPEEINRIVTDSFADLLLTPSLDADENLRKEGVSPEKIKFVGNIMIDALVENLPASRRCGVVEELGLERKSFAYVTLHRPGNVDKRDTFETILQSLDELSKEVPVVFPVHPRTRKMMQEHRLKVSSLRTFKMIEPVGYHESLALTENARLVITDSGGLQEESTYLQIPCLTVRPNTERPITIRVGSNRLTNPDRLAEDLISTLSMQSTGSIPPLWDGRTAYRIVKTLQAANATTLS